MLWTMSHSPLNTRLVVYWSNLAAGQELLRNFTETVQDIIVHAAMLDYAISWSQAAVHKHTDIAMNWW